MILFNENLATRAILIPTNTNTSISISANISLPTSTSNQPTLIPSLSLIVSYPAMIVFNENLSTRAIVGIACSFLAAAYYRRIKVS